MKLATFLQMMIAEEEAAQKKYTLAAESTDDPKAREMLQKLAYEEEMHADLLRQYITSLER